MYGALIKFTCHGKVEADILIANGVEDLYYKLSKLFIQVGIFSKGCQFLQDLLVTYTGGNRCEYNYEGLNIVIINVQDELDLCNTM